jgi:hypothetical protein
MFQISTLIDQLHYDLLLKRLTDSASIEFSNDLEKGTSMDEVLKAAFRRVFLQPQEIEERMDELAGEYVSNPRSENHRRALRIGTRA